MKTLKPRGWEEFEPLIAIRKEFGLTQALVANRARFWQGDISRAENGLIPSVSGQFVKRYRLALAGILEELAAKGDERAAKALEKLGGSESTEKVFVCPYCDEGSFREPGKLAIHVYEGHGSSELCEWLNLLLGID